LKNENRSEPFHSNENLRVEPSISSKQRDFPLCESDYLRLINGKSKSENASLSFFLTSIGFGIAFIAKYVASIIDQKDFTPETWEWIAPLMTGAVSIIIYFVVLFFIENEHRKVMAAIKDHFKTAPRTRHVEGGTE
jgi:hypothetical protein